MAKTTAIPPKTGTLTPFPQAETLDTGTEDANQDNSSAAEAQGPPATPFDPPKRGRGAPKKTDPPVETNFFQRVAAIAPADWGTRVYLYLYQIEPVCDLKQSGGKAYLMRYQEPVRDEQQIMLEQGSGKYRFVLAQNKISPLQSNEMARYEFEIYNPRYPPRIPKAVWINDPRNRRWEALLPKEEPPKPANSLETFVDVMRVTNEMRKEIKDELTPEPAPAQQTAPAAVDPWAAAERILNMRTDNPMIEIFKAQIAAQAASNEAERTRSFQAAEAAREREFKLQEKLLEARTVTAPAPQKSFADQLLELAIAGGDKLDPIKKLFGWTNGAAADVAGRAAKTTMLDVVRDWVSGPAGAPLAQGLSAVLSNLTSPAAMPGQHPAPVVLNAQHSNGTVRPVEGPEERIQRIGAQITRPMLHAFMKEASGADYAQSMFDVMPEDYAFMRALGADDIIRRYRQFPEAWNVISYREQEFIEFMREFCSWDPNTDEAPAPTPGDDGIVDLTAEGGEN